MSTARKPRDVSVDANVISLNYLKDEIVVIFAKCGYTDIRVNESVVRVNQSSALFISSRVLFSFQSRSKDSILYYYRIRLNSLLGNQLSDKDKGIIMRLYNHSFLIHVDDGLQRILTDIVQNDMGSFSDCYLLAKQLEITAHILSRKDLVVNWIFATPTENTDDMWRILEYIEINYHKKITLKSMADHLGYSECYCSRYIKKMTNINFHQHLDTVRIHHAKTLLRQTGDSITQIAYQVGFTSIQTFNRVFRQMNNQSPSDYRRSLYEVVNP